MVCGLLISDASLVVEHEFYTCWLRLLQCVGSVVVEHGLSCSAACGISPDQESKQ